MGEFAAIITALSWSIGIFPFTEAARRFGPNAVNITRLMLAVLLLSVIAVIFFPLNISYLFTFPYPEQWLWFALSGVVGLALGDYFAFYAFAILGPKVGSIFSTLSPGAALITGFFLLGESINWIGILGISVTVSGVIWIILGKKSAEATKVEDFGSRNKGILYGILSALGQGIGLVLSKKAMMYDNSGHELIAIHSIWMRMVASTIVVYFIAILRGQIKEIHVPVFRNKNKGLPYLLAGTFFGPVFGGCLAMYSISMINVSVAQTIFSLVPVFALPLAYLFYREKISLKSLLGALIAVLGVILLIWRDNLFV